MFATQMLGCFLLLAQLSHALPALNTVDSSPWFCHDLDCPRFKTVKTLDAYEVREYKKGVWATTEIETYGSFPVATSIGFKRLFNYIGGENEEDMKINMTAPVLTETTPSGGPFCKQKYTVGFFVPFDLQDNPPKPTSPDVTITEMSAMTVYVAQAGGFKMDPYSIGKMAEALQDALDADGVEFEDSSFYVAGYDPPFRLRDRHTEVWFKSSAEDGTPSVAAQ